MTPPPSSPLHRWLFLGAVGPVLAVLLVDSVVQGLSEQELSRSGIESEARTMATLVGAMAEPAVEFEDDRALGELLAHMQASPRFEFGAVVGPGDRLIRYRGPDDRRDEARALARAGEALVRGGHVVVAVSPIGPGGGLGHLVVAMSTREAEASLREHLLRGVLMDLLAVVIAVGVVAWLVRALRRRTEGIEVQREMLRQTGRLARVGGWELRMPSGQFQLSDEARALLGIDSARAGEVMKAIAVQNRALVDCLDTGAPFDVEVEVLVDGRPRWVRVQGEAERVDGQTRRVFGALQDITEARATREAALSASRSKSQFLANTSHEIRTPLNGILGMTELALEGPLSLEQRSYLESARQSGRTMLAIVNDLLDVARIESGKVTMEASPVQLDEVITSATRALVAQAHRQGLELVFVLEPGVPLGRRADPLRLTQVVTNLVGNALKFTERGQVEVRCARGATPDELRLSVRDTGIGIPSERLDAIFEAFTQSDGTTTRRFGGTGLGLTITRELARLMGGDVRVTSAVGEGSTFTATLKLPLLADEAAPRVERRLLVIEPHDGHAEAIEAVLTRLGAHHHRVRTVAEGLTLALAQAGAGFDGVLVDGALADAREARERLEGQGRDVLVLVPFGTATHEGRAVALPLSVAEVRAALAPPARQTVAAAVAPAVTRRLRVLLAEDNPINATLARRLVERAGHDITHVWNGRAAAEAVAATDFDLVLMDVQMPEMDGMEATRRIRAEESSTRRRVRIYAMTANAMETDRVQCMAAGMDGFLTKPVDVQQLRRLLETLALSDAA